MEVLVRGRRRHPRDVAQRPRRVGDQGKRGVARARHGGCAGDDVGVFPRPAVGEKQAARDDQAHHQRLGLAPAGAGGGHARARGRGVGRRALPVAPAPHRERTLGGGLEADDDPAAPGHQRHPRTPGGHDGLEGAAHRPHLDGGGAERQKPAVAAAASAVAAAATAARPWHPAHRCLLGHRQVSCRAPRRREAQPRARRPDAGRPGWRFAQSRTRPAPRPLSRAFLQSHGQRYVHAVAPAF
mmetsp:Transcript_48212/g.135695  ORF Transcript_48212/g.135695 Transcript_48212/m.135695 type:complete len:241 (-) Transcript_48212:23-745(-)